MHPIIQGEIYMENMQSSKAKVQLADHWDLGGDAPHPRCLAVLPKNIDALINKFNAQEAKSSIDSGNLNPQSKAF